MLKERESARATSTVYPFPLIEQNKGNALTQMVIAQSDFQLSRDFSIALFPFLSPVRFFSFLEINTLTILKLCITPITPHVKSNVYNRIT